MYLSLFVTFVLLSVASATSPILVSECGTLDTPFSTYQLARNILVRNTSYGFVCFDITGEGITLDGNGFELSSASNNQLLHATAVQYTGAYSVVKNLVITNIRTGIHAKGKFGEVFNNTITRAINGIDVSATNNKIDRNVIGEFEAYESTAGIYVYFPDIEPIDSYITITNNVISDIRGDTFALGVSVYYAKAVVIAHNQIFNVLGGISSQDISVIQGSVNAEDNYFVPPPVEGAYTQVITAFASLFALAASYVFYQATSVTSKTSAPIPPAIPFDFKFAREEKDEKETEMEKEKEREEFEKDGADVRPTMSISLGSSPAMRE